jgi:hypothetical protein
MPHFLWLGHADDGRDFRQIFDAGIKALVHVAVEDVPTQPPRDLTYCRFPLLDGSGNDSNLLMLAIRTVSRLLTMRIPTLVFCGAGLSRSPAIAAAGLSLAHHETPEACLQRIVQYHPCDVSPALWNDIIALLPGLRG